MELRAKKVSLTVHILELNHIVIRRFSILQSKYQFQKIADQQEHLKFKLTVGFFMGQMENLYVGLL